MDQCPECGADVEASASYCFSCGEDLSNGGDPSANRMLDDHLVDVEYELDKAYNKIERLERGNARLRREAFTSTICGAFLFLKIKLIKNLPPRLKFVRISVI